LRKENVSNPTSNFEEEIKLIDDIKLIIVSCNIKILLNEKNIKTKFNFFIIFFSKEKCSK